MSLADRMAAKHRQEAGHLPPVLVERPAAVPASVDPAPLARPRPPAHAAPRPETSVPPTTSRTPAPGPLASDGLAQTKARVLKVLHERIGSRINDPSLTEGQLHDLVRTELAKVVDDERLVLAPGERRAVLQELEDDALGLGPLQRLLEDPTVNEIMVNGHDTIYVERNGITLSGLRFTDEDHLRRVIERIVARVGRRIDESSPLVDARLQDGSRVNAVIPPLAVNGSSLTIRKFSDTPFTVDDLISFGSFSGELADFFRGCVEARLNILVSGGTGTGKTTMLNVLSSFVPADERIVTIEDAVELKLQQDHVVTLESRPPNIEGKGEVTIRDLVRNSLRMRPDRIIVGECRGGEALDMLQAMNTGHEGSISTLHANSPRDALARLETLVLMAGMDLPLRAIREQAASAIDLVIQVQRMRDGSRRVTQVTEVIGMEGDVVTLQDAFVLDRARGEVRPTGLRPRFLDRFDEAGVPYDLSMFDPAA
ncbi:CpaF family protein [Aeromicrobium endophyticum]|uniref:CpaF family protein n=1 Tax=Aeromicrobium endophyticum TaxID=2292704 RepID=A0A371PDB8_9ACTN|nr:CpaF family protein [Aeromicrobium endophyticum]REK73904.1 CpaF family protein [Aeromicrobium endophyticum]